MRARPENWSGPHVSLFGERSVLTAATASQLANQEDRASDLAHTRGEQRGVYDEDDSRRLNVRGPAR